MIFKNFLEAYSILKTIGPASDIKESIAVFSPEEFQYVKSKELKHVEILDLKNTYHILLEIEFILSELIYFMRLANIDHIKIQEPIFLVSQDGQIHTGRAEVRYDDSIAMVKLPDGTGTTIDISYTTTISFVDFLEKKLNFELSSSSPQSISKFLKSNNNANFLNEIETDYYNNSLPHSEYLTKNYRTYFHHLFYFSSYDSMKLYERITHNLLIGLLYYPEIAFYFPLIETQEDFIEIDQTYKKEVFNRLLFYKTLSPYIKDFTIIPMNFDLYKDPHLSLWLSDVKDSLFNAKEKWDMSILNEALKKSATDFEFLEYICQARYCASQANAQVGFTEFSELDYILFAVSKMLSDKKDYYKPISSGVFTNKIIMPNLESANIEELISIRNNSDVFNELRQDFNNIYNYIENTNSINEKAFKELTNMIFKEKKTKILLDLKKNKPRYVVNDSGISFIIGSTIGSILSGDIIGSGASGLLAELALYGVKRIKNQKMKKNSEMLLGLYSSFSELKTK